MLLCAPCRTGSYRKVYADKLKTTISIHLLNLTIIIAFKQLLHSDTWMFLHITIDHPDIVCIKYVGSHHFICHPHHLPHVKVLLQLRSRIIILQGIETQQIETNAIGNDIGTIHSLQLLTAVIELLIDRIFGTQIFVELDAYHLVTYHNTLIQRSNLRINARQGKLWDPLSKCRERLTKALTNIIHIGIFKLYIADKSLQR